MVIIPEHEVYCYRYGSHEWVVCAYTLEGYVLAVFYACQWCGRQLGY
jgi:hypothetical protein